MFFTKLTQGGDGNLRAFRGKIAEQKKLRRLTNGDIAKMTGYSVSTINAFMAGRRENDKIANAIAKVLDIER